MTALDPCRDCPWRVSNRGRRHPDGWYTQANLRRLWTQIRRTGVLNSCHPTDPGNPVSERAQAAGYREAPEHAQTRECVGAVILVQRELQEINDTADVKAYRAARPLGLLPEAAIALAFRVLVPVDNLVTGRGMPARPDLNHPDVDHAPLGAWRRRVPGAAGGDR